MNGFVVQLYTPYDEFDLAADIVEITAQAYSEAITSPDKETDFKVIGQDLVLDVTSQTETIRLETVEKDKGVRNNSLDNLTHDFLDGRIMQVRPKDESNIRNAIEVMTANSMTTIDWVMLDDKKYPVTIPELQAALLSGQTQAMAVWAEFNP